MAVAGNVAASVRLQVVIGNDLQQVVTFVDDAGDPVDLTGSTWEAAIVTAAGSAIATCTVVTTGAASGELRIDLTDTQTAALSANSAARWYLNETTSGGVTRTLLSGACKITTEQQSSAVSGATAGVEVTVVDGAVLEVAYPAVSAFLSAAQLRSFGTTVPKTGEYVGTPHATRVAGTPTHDRQHFTPLWLPVACSIDRIAVEAVGATASATCRVGVFRDNNGVPGTLFTEAVIDCSGSTGLLTATVDIDVERGMYWLAAAMQGATTSMRCISAPVTVLSRNTPEGGSPPVALVVAGVTGSFTSNPTTEGSTAAATCPLVWVRANP